MVQVEYDPRADALYIWVRKAKYEISEELAENEQTIRICESREHPPESR